MKASDPLSVNAFRLRGLTVDCSPASSPRTPWQLPGLSPPADFVEGQFPWEVHQATWFSASRPLDQACLEKIAQGHEQQAFLLWDQDEGQESLHNLAILEYLWLLREPSPPHWRAVLGRWNALANMTRHAGYLWVVARLEETLREEVDLCLARHCAGEARTALEIIALGLDAERCQAIETEAFKDDLESLTVRCAQMRQLILRSQDVLHLDEAGLRFQQEILPLAEFIRAASLLAGPVQYEVLRQVATFYRSLSRGYRDLPSRDKQLACLEAACTWAPLDLREEFLPELEHVRFEEYSPLATLRQQDLGPRRVMSRSLLGAIVLGVFLVLAYFTLRTGQTPKTNLNFTRKAVEVRIPQVLAEINATLTDLKATRRSLRRKSTPKLEEHLRVLKDRHARLVNELARLEQIRNRSQ